MELEPNIALIFCLRSRLKVSVLGFASLASLCCWLCLTMTFLLIAQTGSTQSCILANGKRLYTSFVNWQAFCRVCWWVVNCAQCAAVRRLAGSVNIEEGSQRLCAAARARTTWLEVDRRASENTVELALCRPSLEVAPIVSVSAAFSCRHRTLRSCELR